MDVLTQNWRRLTLSDREGPGCILTKDDSSNDFSIVTKFFTKKALNINVIARTFNPLWRSRSGLKIKSLDDHIILFTFDNKDDVDRILLSELWSFDKHLVVLQSCSTTRHPFTLHDIGSCLEDKQCDWRSVSTEEV